MILFLGPAGQACLNELWFECIAFTPSATGPGPDRTRSAAPPPYRLITERHFHCESWGDAVTISDIMATQVNPLRAFNDERDGMLFIPAQSIIHTVGNPGWAGSDVAATLKHTITKWTDHGKDPLFRQPTMDIGDINQEGVGDCWYLSALVSILHCPNGTTLLKKTMLDTGDGFVIVRLFDGDLNPWYLKVKKTILWTSKFNTKVHVSGIGQTGLWATMLEKAACCFTKASDRKVCDPNNPNYLNLESGGGHEAFRMLLGVRSFEMPTADLNRQGKKEGRRRADQHLHYLFTRGTWRILSQEDLRDASESLYAVFGWGGMTVERWKPMVSGMQNDNPLLARGPNFLELLKVGTYYGPSIPPDVASVITRYARSIQISGPSGSGTYSVGAENLFNTIRTKLGAGCPVSFGTIEHIGPAQGIGKSAGETMSFGMVGKHAYAILGVVEENVAQRRKFVKVSNPWNRYGRTYADTGSVLTYQEQECGTFFIELTDLCNVIKQLYYAEAPGMGR